MAHTIPFQDTTDKRLEAFSKRLGESLRNAPGQNMIKNAGLAESFAIWLLDSKHLKGDKATLPKEPTPYRHYQLFLDGHPSAYAVGKQLESEIQLNELVMSPLVLAIDNAIKQVDDYDNGDTPVNYLVVPSCLVYAFLLVASEEVCLIAAPPPPRSIPKGKRLKAGMILAKKGFLKRLMILHKTLSKESKQKSGRRKK
jgi:hypothetical protein